METTFQKAYRAYLDYVEWRYRVFNAGNNAQGLMEYSLAQSYGLDSEGKHYLSAWVWQFEKHGRRATDEATRSTPNDWRVDV